MANQECNGMRPGSDLAAERNRKCAPSDRGAHEKIRPVDERARIEEIRNGLPCFRNEGFGKGSPFLEILDQGGARGG